MDHVDVVVLGAGAAGLFCAATAGQRGARVVVIDHAEHRAEKIRISGGGRCNFTNLQADRPDRFIGERPEFARHALRAYPPARFIELVRGAGIDFHEKHRGQLFCDDSSQQIIDLLLDLCEAAQVRILAPVRVHDVRRTGDGLEVDTSAATLRARRLVVATGGLSIPKIGASDLGYRIARQFGLRVVEPRPGLVPLTFDPQTWAPFATLAGVPLSVEIAIAEDPQRSRFQEDLLFTHRGLSGPGVLQVSSHWREGHSLTIALTGSSNPAAELRALRERTRLQLETALGSLLPRRLAQVWLAQSVHAPMAHRKLAEMGNRALEALAADLKQWRIQPVGSEGWRKAEVTVGGVATDELDSRTLQALKVPGLHFVGEVVDITGWLGGYNFQWAWSSAWAAAQAVARGSD
jgi:predicted Rossmann fold flavoprotein